MHLSRCHGKTGKRGSLCGADGSRYRRHGCDVLPRPLVGTADGEYRDCAAVRGVLFEVSEAGLKEIQARSGNQLDPGRRSFGAREIQLDNWGVMIRRGV